MKQPIRLTYWKTYLQHTTKPTTTLLTNSLRHIINQWEQTHNQKNP